MKLDFSSLFSLLFPPSDDEKLLASLSQESFVQKLQVDSQQNITTLSSFKDPLIRAAIHLVKYHNHSHASTLLGALLESYLMQVHQGTEILLVPLPLSKQRERKRGYNQVQKVIQNCELPRNITCTQLLARTTNTAPQTTLSRKKRLTNLQNAFSIKPTFQKAVRGKHIMVLDDVTTTGATLHEAQRALAKHSPASITCVALAH